MVAACLVRGGGAVPRVVCWCHSSAMQVTASHMENIYTPRARHVH